MRAARWRCLTAATCSTLAATASRALAPSCSRTRRSSSSTSAGTRAASVADERRAATRPARDRAARRWPGVEAGTRCACAGGRRSWSPPLEGGLHVQRARSWRALAAAGREYLLQFLLLSVDVAVDLVRRPGRIAVRREVERPGDAVVVDLLSGMRGGEHGRLLRPGVCLPGRA